MAKVANSESVSFTQDRPFQRFRNFSKGLVKFRTPKGHKLPGDEANERESELSTASKGPDSPSASVVHVQDNVGTVRVLPPPRLKDKLGEHQPLFSYCVYCSFNISQAVILT